MTDNIQSITSPNTNTPPNSERLLRWPEVQERVGICRSHAHQLVAKGQFPQPIKLVPGGRASAWRERAISDWIAQRIAESAPTNPEAA